MSQVNNECTGIHINKLWQRHQGWAFHSRITDHAHSILWYGH